MIPTARKVLSETLQHAIPSLPGFHTLTSSTRSSSTQCIIFSLVCVIQGKILRPNHELTAFHELFTNVRLHHGGKLPKDIGMPSGGLLTADQWLLLSTVYGPIVISLSTHSHIYANLCIRSLSCGVLVSQVLRVIKSCKIVLHRFTDSKRRRVVKWRRNSQIGRRSRQPVKNDTKVRAVAAKQLEKARLAAEKKAQKAQLAA
jgi:hypothetical protein